MSQENVELVRVAYEALTSGGVDAFSDYWADDIEWRTMRASWYGKEAGRAYLKELFDLFDDFTTEPIEFIDAADERVVLYLRYGGRSKLSGVTVPPEYFAIVLQIRDGKIVRGVEYGTREEALEAVGLPEQMVSLENVEVVRRFLVLDVDEALAYADPDIVWNPAEESPTQGHDAVRASLVRWKSEWEDYELLAEEFEHMGDRVIATVRLRGRGRGSGVEIDARFYELFRLRNGKIMRMDQFTKRSDALEAAGLREQAISRPVRSQIPLMISRLAS